MKIVRKIAVIVLLLVPHGGVVQADPLETLLKDGDIIFHTSRSSQSLAIQRATGSKYSHMGIILFWAGSPMVFEAVQTVRYTPLRQWIERGEGGHFVVKRLSDAGRIINADSIGKLQEEANTFEGKPYDLTFEWSDDRIYCSELVWKIYDRALGIHIGELRHLREFRLDDPAVRGKLRERYGKAIPLNEPVISPGAMFDALNLVVVVRQ